MRGRRTWRLRLHKSHESSIGPVFILTQTKHLVDLSWPVGSQTQQPSHELDCVSAAMTATLVDRSGASNEGLHINRHSLSPYGIHADACMVEYAEENVTRLSHIAKHALLAALPAHRNAMQSSASVRSRPRCTRLRAKYCKPLVSMPLLSTA